LGRDLHETGLFQSRPQPFELPSAHRLTGYILGAALPKAQADIAEAERLKLTERDSLRVLDLLENPPAAPEHLVRAAKAAFRLP